MTASDENLFQQHTDIEVLELLIPCLAHSSFLDVGAAKGEFTRFFAKQGLKGVFFEPLSDCAKELTQLAEQTGSVFLPYAIDDHDHTANFYQAIDKNNNDVLHFSSLHPLKDDSRIKHKKKHRVQCKSLNNLLKESVIPEVIGVIKIDTEGNDLNVLKGMQEVKAEVLMCEYFMPKIYEGWEQGHPDALIQAASELGFNHCLSIKRIGLIETVSLDDNTFIDKQWGNLIFISDPIFKQIEPYAFFYV